MLDVYYWPTPNGRKITIFLEEAGVPYNLIPVDIGKGEQFRPAFLAISPNNRMPAIVDHDPEDGGAPISVFESAAILTYLGEKTGKFLPADVRGRVAVAEWLSWQISGLGPNLGQAGHFRNYAPDKIPYAIERYEREVKRLFKVMDTRLTDRDYLAGDYSIADMACFPWVWAAPKITGEDFADFPALDGWRARVADRDGVKRGMDVGKDLMRPMSEEDKKNLFRK